MTWDRLFLVIQRTASVLVLVVAAFALVVIAIEYGRPVIEDQFVVDRTKYDGKFERTLPYSGQEIETAEGSLIAVFQDDGNPGERIELGGITLTNPTTGKAIELATGGGAGVVQFELIFDQGDDGKVVGYLATVATTEQHAEGRQDLLVGALPAMTRNVVATNIRYSDLPRIRGDGSVGFLMWPEEGEAYLVSIRLDDGAVIERVRVKLPALRENGLSQGPGIGHFALGRGGMPDDAPVVTYAE